MKVSRLSEAIRWGAMLHPQCANALAQFNGAVAIRGVILTHTCAMGAAAEALWGGEIFRTITNATVRERLEKHYRLSTERDKHCPMCTEIRSLMGIVTHLNDQHGWTREAIADWVAKVEEPEPPEPEEPAEDEEEEDEPAEPTVDEAELVPA